MPGQFIKIEINDGKIRQALQKLAKKTGNLAPVMRALAAKLMSITEENFHTEGARLGKKWAPLKPSTQRWRDKTGYTGKMLQVKRKLLNSISSRADDDSAIVGTNLVYARVHQFGIDDSVSVRAFSRKDSSKNIYRKRKDGKGYTKTLDASGIGYVKAHRRNMKIPARPFLELNDSDKNNLTETILDYLKKE